MKCPVCSVAFADGAPCPQCGFNPETDASQDPAKILELREKFQNKVTAYAPETRVRAWDKLRPWVATLLGFVLFIFWLRACSSGGWRLW